MSNDPRRTVLTAFRRGRARNGWVCTDCGRQYPVEPGDSPVGVFARLTVHLLRRHRRLPRSNGKGLWTHTCGDEVLFHALVPLSDKTGSQDVSDDSQSFFWYFAERSVCGKPVHHQHHAACVRSLNHGPEVECDGYYEPTVEERIALWRAAAAAP